MKEQIVCPNCKILISPKVEGDQVFVECTNCGYKAEFKDWSDHECRKCGFNKAVILFHAFMKGDEGTTTMYRCLRCGATQREGYLA